MSQASYDQPRAGRRPASAPRVGRREIMHNGGQGRQEVMHRDVDRRRERMDNIGGRRRDIMHKDGRGSRQDIHDDGYGRRDVIQRDSPAHLHNRSSVREVPVMRVQPRAASSSWKEGRPVVSKHGFVVEHMGGHVDVRANEVYYVDKSGRVLVGWDGTVSPPCGMDGEPLVEHSDRPHQAVAQTPLPNRPRPRTAGQPGRVDRHQGAKMSSSNFKEAQPRVSDKSFVVKYAGGDLEVGANDVYYVDNAGRVLAGWYGTVSPPCDVDGRSLVDEEAWVAPPRSRGGHSQSRLAGGVPRLSSNFWEEAQSEVSDRRFAVKHAGGQLWVQPNEIYYVDNLGRVLVGWHGTVSPPCDIDGNPLVMC